jgi:choline kinase
MENLLMKAIVYGAGRANRLGKISEHQPKILLKFGGNSLLERHVAILAALSVPELFVVTGYLRELVAAECANLQRRYGVRIKEIFNPDFLEGSALSMHASVPILETANEGILLLDGDVLCDQRMFDRLVHSPHPTVLLIDRAFSTADDDPVLVPVRDGKPFEFIKKWKGDAEVIGESIGFFRVGAADIALLVKETKARATGAGRKDSYDEILRVLVRSGRFGAEDVTGIPWMEIDFPEDIGYANNTILPKLQT